MGTAATLEAKTNPRHRVDGESASAAPSLSSVLTVEDSQWRQLNPSLWAGRRDGMPIGTIEHHRRFVANDCDGVSYGYFDTMDEGVHALLVPQSGRRLRGRRLHGGWFLHLSALAVGLAVIVGLLSAVLWYR